MKLLKLTKTPWKPTYLSLPRLGIYRCEILLLNLRLLHSIKKYIFWLSIKKFMDPLSGCLIEADQAVSSLVCPRV